MRKGWIKAKWGKIYGIEHYVYKKTDMFVFKIADEKNWWACGGKPLYVKYNSCLDAMLSIEKSYKRGAK